MSASETPTARRISLRWLAVARAAPGGGVAGAGADVGAAAGLTLLHVRLRNAYGPQDLLEVVGRSPRRLRRGYVWLGDDLHKRRAPAVEVHERADRAVHPARGAHVHVLGGVLLQVQACDTDPNGAVRGWHVQIPAGADRLVELAYLVPLRPVGGGVVFPGGDCPGGAGGGGGG